MKRSLFIIGEIGANHLGSLDRALAIVDAAADAGVDLVKLQAWTPGTMSYHHDPLPPDSPWHTRTLPDLYAECFTPWAWFPPIFDYAMAKGIIPFASAFDIEAVEMLAELRCPIHKIASNEITDHQLIRRMGRTGRPLLISTGCASAPDIGGAVRTARNAGAQDITLLQCTSEYPAPVESANLATMNDMRHRWGCEAGLSDHTVGIGVAVAAAALGAAVIEKHLTLERADGGPDAGFSMEPAEFKAMVTACRQAALARGSVEYASGPWALRRSLWVVKDMAPGDEFTALNVRTARPNLGLDCREVGNVYGRYAAVRIQAGTPLAQGMIE